MTLSPTATALATGFALLGSAKLAKAPFMVARAAHLDMSARSYQLIGLSELAAAAGVLAGLKHAIVGRAAGIGLLGLLGGAVRKHVRHGDGPRELVPAGVFAAGVVAYLVSLRGGVR